MLFLQLSCNLTLLEDPGFSGYCKKKTHIFHADKFIRKAKIHSGNYSAFLATRKSTYKHLL